MICFERNRTAAWAISLLISVLVFVGCASRDKSTASSTSTELKPELISFNCDCDDAVLHGWIYKPKGKGPFPAVLYNHGSDKVPGWFPTLGEFWTQHGFVFFVPHRRGHGRSEGDYIVDLQEKFRAGEKDVEKVRQHTIQLHEKANLDVEDAVDWLRKQKFVDTNRMVMAGISYGGIQTVLAAEKGLGMKAFIPFSPAAMSWAGNPLLRERLLEAVKHAKAPMFLLQADNDYNLGPNELLGGQIKTMPQPNRAKLYPAFGDKDNPRDGHGGFAVRGSDVWGPDVLAFVEEAFARRK